jgi:hypothetical protein
VHFLGDDMNLRYGAALAAALGAIGAGGAVVAQQAQDWQFPNPLQEGNLAATCQNFQAMMQQADPRAMQMLAGVWQGQGMIPGVQGIMPDTPIQFQTQNDANGNFQQERYGCFTMQSVPGMPSLGESCSTSMLYGQFAARFVDQTTLIVATMQRGTHFTGAPIPPNCGVGYFRFLDQNTLVDQGGNRQVRVRGN